MKGSLRNLCPTGLAAIQNIWRPSITVVLTEKSSSVPEFQKSSAWPVLSCSVAGVDANNVTTLGPILLTRTNCYPCLPGMAAIATIGLLQTLGPFSLTRNYCYLYLTWHVKISGQLNAFFVLFKFNSHVSLLVCCGQ